MYKRQDLDSTVAELEREDIVVLDCPLRANRCLALANGRMVGVDSRRFGTQAELRTCLFYTSRCV